MKIDSIEIKGFRNLQNCRIEPDPGINVIYGENAQGKTNFIEAVWMFSGMKSFRGAKDAELKAFDSEFAKIKIEFENSLRVNTAEITITDKRKAVLNGVGLPSPSSLLGKFGAVVFSPSFLSIIQSGPSERRKFTDSAICRIKPSYAVLLSEYTRLLKQRNSLLKDVYSESSLFDMLDVIDEKLCSTGKKITAEREKFLEQILPFVCGIYSGLSSGKEELSVKYIKKYESYADDLETALKNTKKTDLINKTTNAGPHRDDIEIFINGISARLYGSQGQQRSCALALKLGEAAVIKNVTGEEPVTLLDDVMSELDTGRQDYILNHIKDRQVFITCCDPSSVIRLDEGKRISVSGGKITGCT